MKKKRNFSQLFSKENTSLLGILLLSIYLRLWRIKDYMTFLGDEGRDVLIVKRLIVDFDIPFIGPTASVGGFFLGPIYYYFMAPFLALFRLDPVGPAIMVALFGIATIYLLYRVGKEWYSTRVGLIAALLYTVSPLVVAHSRSSWNPNIVPFFALLYIYSLWKAVSTHRSRWYAIVGACVGIGIQLHYLFIFLIPVGVLYVLLFDRTKKSLKNYFIGILSSVAVLIPFLGFEFKNNFMNFNAIIGYLFKSSEVVYGGDNMLTILNDVVFRLFGRLIFLFPPAEQVEFAKDAVIKQSTALINLVLFVVIGYLLYRMIRYKSKQDILLGIWLSFGVGLFTFYKKEIYDYYFVIIFPLPFLLFSMFLDIFWYKKVLKILVIIIVSLLFYINWQARPFRYPANKQAVQMESIAQKVFDEADNQPYNFALLTNGNSDHAYRYFLEVWGNPPVTIENTDNDPERNTVMDQLFVVCEFKDCQPLGNALWEIAGFDRAEIAGQWEQPTVMIYRLVQYKDEVVYPSHLNMLPTYRQAGGYIPF